MFLRTSLPYAHLCSAEGMDMAAEDADGLAGDELAGHVVAGRLDARADWPNGSGRS